jgi:hypothetical protein
VSRSRSVLSIVAVVVHRLGHLRERRVLALHVPSGLARIVVAALARRRSGTAILSSRRNSSVSGSPDVVRCGARVSLQAWRRSNSACSPGFQIIVHDEVPDGEFIKAAEALIDAGSVCI